MIHIYVIHRERDRKRERERERERKKPDATKVASGFATANRRERKRDAHPIKSSFGF